MKKGKPFQLLSIFGVWLLLAVFANINGAVRAFLIVPLTGEPAGHIISCFTMSTAIILVAYFYTKKKGITENKVLFSIGLIWFLITIVFEFVFGHYVFNHSWEKLFHDYNILAGRLWIVVLLTTLFSPLISGLLINRKVKIRKES